MILKGAKMRGNGIDLLVGIPVPACQEARLFGLTSIISVKNHGDRA